MRNALLLWLLISPLALAGFWLLMAGRGYLKIKYLGAAALLACNGILALLATRSASPTDALCLFSHPSAGEMCVLMDTSSMKLIALLYLSMSILIATRVNSLAISPIQASFLFASLSAGSLALMAEHFLLRYIALELAAIWFLIELFLAFQGEEMQIRRSISAFINLRVGDSGLLIAIFLMLSASGSFIIMRSLKGALALSHDHLAITIFGLVLAVWVKLGTWPLNWWSRIGAHLHASLFTWFCRLLIPVMGGYLLYRSAALIMALPSIARLVFILASVCALTSAVIRIFQKAYRDTILANQSYASCLLLGLAATDNDNQLLPAMISFLVVRILIDLLRHTEEEFDAQIENRRIMGLLAVRMLELLLFMPLIFIISAPDKSIVWLLMLWTGFGLQALLTGGKMDMYFFARSDNTRPIKAILQTGGLICASAAGAFFLHQTALLWMQSDHQLWPIQFHNQTWHTCIVMIIGIFLATLLLTAVRYAQKSPALKSLAYQTSQAIIKLIPQHTETGGARDYLDQTPVLVRAYRRVMRFLQESDDIFDQYPRLISAFERMVQFIYDRVEQFTSVDIWQNLQETLFNLARRLQNLHTGKVRMNLLWVIALLVIMVVLYLSGHLDVINALG